MAKATISNEKNQILSQSIFRELESLRLKNLDKDVLLKEYQKLAETSKVKEIYGKITDLLAEPGFNLIVVKSDNNALYWVYCPDWAFDLAKDAFFHKKYILIYHNNKLQPIQASEVTRITFWDYSS